LAPDRPFFLLLRSRRAWFRRQSFALYRRYAQVAGVLLMFGGVLLAERPSLIAAPILHFWRPPGSLFANAGWAAAWLGVVYVWVRIHRGFVLGGAMAGFARSLPGGVRAGPLVDAAMLLISLQIFLLPIGVAAWTVAQGGGAGWAFAARAVLLAMLTLGTALLALGGSQRIGGTLLAGWVVLCGAGAAAGGPMESLAMLLAALSVGAVVLRAMKGGVAPPLARSLRVAPPAPAGPDALFLLRLQCLVLARRHPHAALPRVLFAASILLAGLYMIFGVGKHGESDAFVQVACWAAIAVMSGFFHLFWNTRQPLQAWLSSIPHGVLRMALAEQALVVGATALLFGAAWIASMVQPEHGAVVAGQVLRHGGFALLVLPLLGLPVIQRREDGVLFKFVILVASFLLF